MADTERRKCKCCHKLFRPDPRNRHHQRYCAAPSCRAASKAASQARWLAAPENQDYFRGPVNVARVKIVCGEGSFLDDDNKCVKRREKKPVAARDRPQATQAPEARQAPGRKQATAGRSHNFG